MGVAASRRVALTASRTGIFELIACIMIFVMGVTMLKMDRAKAKWRVKLQKAFDGQRAYFPPHLSRTVVIDPAISQTSTERPRAASGSSSSSP